MEKVAAKANELVAVVRAEGAAAGSERLRGKQRAKVNRQPSISKAHRPSPLLDLINTLDDAFKSSSPARCPSLRSDPL
jgi:hypothetical protein